MKLARSFGLGLAVYLVFHVFETASAVGGREAFLGRAAAVVPPWMRVAIVAPLLFHLRLLFGRRGADDPGAFPDPGVRKLQLLSGVVVLGFLLVHLGHTLVPAALVGEVAAYERLRQDLGLSGYAAVYVVGITASCLHFAQGLEAAAARLRDRFGESGVRVGRALGLAAGVAVYAVAMNTLSHFVAGRAFVAPGVPR